MSWFVIYSQGHFNKTPKTYFIWKLSGPCQQTIVLFPTKNRTLIKHPVPGSSSDPKGTAQNTERFAKRWLILQNLYTCPQKSKIYVPAKKEMLPSRAIKSRDPGPFYYHWVSQAMTDGKKWDCKPNRFHFAQNKLCWEWQRDLRFPKARPLRRYILHLGSVKGTAFQLCCAERDFYAISFVPRMQVEGILGSMSLICTGSHWKKNAAGMGKWRKKGCCPRVVYVLFHWQAPNICHWVPLQEIGFSSSMESHAMCSITGRLPEGSGSGCLLFWVFCHRLPPTYHQCSSVPAY